MVYFFFLILSCLPAVFRIYEYINNMFSKSHFIESAMFIDCNSIPADSYINPSVRLTVWRSANLYTFCVGVLYFNIRVHCNSKTQQERKPSFFCLFFFISSKLTDHHYMLEYSSNICVPNLLGHPSKSF